MLQDVGCGLYTSPYVSQLWGPKAWAQGNRSLNPQALIRKSWHRVRNPRSTRRPSEASMTTTPALYSQGRELQTLDPKPRTPTPNTEIPSPGLLKTVEQRMSLFIGGLHQLRGLLGLRPYPKQRNGAHVGLEHFDFGFTDLGVGFR